MRSMDKLRTIFWGWLQNCWKVGGQMTGHKNFRFEDKVNMISKDNFLRLAPKLLKYEATWVVSKFSIPFWGLRTKNQPACLAWSCKQLLPAGCQIETAGFLLGLVVAYPRGFFIRMIFFIFGPCGFYLDCGFSKVPGDVFYKEDFSLTTPVVFQIS